MVTDTVSILTPAEIVVLLGRDGSREDMLQEAARMGALWAAQMCQVGAANVDSPVMAAAATTCADAIRAAVGE